MRSEIWSGSYAIVTLEVSRGYWSGHEICGLRVERNSTGRSCDVVRLLPARIASANIIILPLVAEGIKTRQRRPGNRGGRQARSSGCLAGDQLLWSRGATDDDDDYRGYCGIVTVNDAVPTVPAAVLLESDTRDGGDF